MDRFRDYLDVLCRSRGVTYAEVARRVGVTKSYIGQLVHGHSKPPPAERCKQLAEALDLAPAERQRLLNLAVRERARIETRVKIEELDGRLSALRSAVADTFVALLGAVARGEEPAPEDVAELLASDELLADLHAIMTSGAADPRSAVAERLAEVSPERLASEVTSLVAALGTMAPSAEAEAAARAGHAVRLLPDIPLIGHVAAGETNISFTDAGLPTGATLPGEEPIPRWAGIGEYAYALRITGESMRPLCPPGTTIVVDPERTPRNGEPAICQTTAGTSYFKLVYFEPAGRVRLVSSNQAAARDMVLKRNEVRRLHKVVAVIYH